MKKPGTRPKMELTQAYDVPALASTRLRWMNANAMPNMINPHTRTLAGANTPVVAMMVEAMTRRGFALGLAPLLGVLGLVLARRFEMGDALHNFGSTAGKTAIWAFYAVEVLVLVFGAVAWARSVRREAAVG